MSRQSQQFEIKGVGKKQSFTVIDELLLKVALQRYVKSGKEWADQLQRVGIGAAFITAPFSPIDLTPEVNQELWQLITWADLEEITAKSSSYDVDLDEEQVEKLRARIINPPRIPSKLSAQANEALWLLQAPMPRGPLRISVLAKPAAVLSAQAKPIPDSPAPLTTLPDAKLQTTAMPGIEDICKALLAGDLWALKEVLKPVASADDSESLISRALNYGDSLSEKRLLFGAEVSKEHFERMLAELIAINFSWSLAEKNMALAALAQRKISLHPLLIAALNGDHSGVDTEIARAHLKIMDSRGNTAIHYASANNQLLTVQFLLEKQWATLGEKNHQGLTPLQMAARQGQLATVRWLLSKGGRAEITGENSHILLKLAAASGNAELLATLIRDYGIDPGDGREISAVAKGECLDIAKNKESSLFFLVEGYSLKQIAISKLLVDLQKHQKSLNPLTKWKDLSAKLNHEISQQIPCDLITIRAAVKTFFLDPENARIAGSDLQKIVKDILHKTRHLESPVSSTREHRRADEKQRQTSFANQSPLSEENPWTSSSQFFRPPLPMNVELREMGKPATMTATFNPE